jgi:hypothetical protein
LGFVLTIVSSDAALAQYSKEILSRPNANATLGPYNAGMLRRSGFDIGAPSGAGHNLAANHSHTHHGHHFHGGHSGVTWFIDAPFYGYDLGRTSVYGYGSPLIYGYGNPYSYPYGYGYGWPYYLDTGAGPLGPFVAPPVHVPAEQLGFGPAAVRRFMGLDGVQQPAVNRNVVVVPPDAGINGQDGVAGKRAVRVSNAEARERARRFIELGDAHFDAGKLAQAYDRYKMASQAAPDLAEPFFRQGQVHVAMRRYDQAATAFRRGLGVQPDWSAQGFRLDLIYRDNHAAREAMLDALRRAAAAQLDDVNVQFVAAVQYFFNGQEQESRTHFERAKALGEPAATMEPFLRLLKAPAPDAELDI